MCLTGAAAMWSRTTSAKSRKRRAQSRLIRAMVAAASFTPRRSAINLHQTLLGQQLVVQEIEHERADPRAVLRRHVDAVRKQRTRSAPQAAHLQSCARCSVTTRGRGSGRSNTCRALWPTLVSDPGPRRTRSRPTVTNRSRRRDRRPAAASRLCGPSARPVSCRTGPAGSSPAPASSAHHSTEACRCSNCSTRAGARAPPAAPSATHSRPAGPRPAREGRPSMAHAAAIRKLIRCFNSNPVSSPSREFFRRTPLSPNLGSY